MNADKDAVMQLSARPFINRVSDAVTKQIETPTVVTVERSPTGSTKAPLSPVDERPPTSLELLRQLEGFVREHFEISARS